MDISVGPQNYQLLLVLARRVVGLVVALINHVRRDCPLTQESFRQVLRPMHRVLSEFLSEQSPPFSQSFHLRDPAPSFRTLPSMPHTFHGRESRHLTVGTDPPALLGNITPPDDITPPGTPRPTWSSTPLGFTSTPFRTPVIRPRPEPFALINQLLTVVRTSDDGNMTNVTDRFANDPVFRERILNELDELRSLIIAQPGRALNTLLNRVEQAEITLSSLVHHLQHLENAN